MHSLQIPDSIVVTKHSLPETFKLVTLNGTELGTVDFELVNSDGGEAIHIWLADYQDLAPNGLMICTLGAIMDREFRKTLHPNVWVTEIGPENLVHTFQTPNLQAIVTVVEVLVDPPNKFAWFHLNISVMPNQPVTMLTLPLTEPVSRRIDEAHPETHRHRFELGSESGQRLGQVELTMTHRHPGVIQLSVFDTRAREYRMISLVPDPKLLRSRLRNILDSKSQIEQLRFNGVYALNTKNLGIALRVDSARMYDDLIHELGVAITFRKKA
jgi:hypothetical protein